MLSNILSLDDDQVLRNVASQLVLLGLRQALLESVCTLHDVLLVQAQVLVDKEHFWNSRSKLLECAIEVLAPFGVLACGDSLRTNQNLQVLLDVLVISLEWVVDVKALNPGSVDFDLINIFFIFIVVALVLFVVLILLLNL